MLFPFLEERKEKNTTMYMVPNQPSAFSAWQTKGVRAEWLRRGQEKGRRQTMGVGAEPRRPWALRDTGAGRAGVCLNDPADWEAGESGGCGSYLAERYMGGVIQPEVEVVPDSMQG